MATWKPAPSVAAALKEATTRWPNRSRASDGTIGDTAHQARPTSDHNPDSRGIVHAFDLTDDPVGGVDCDDLSAMLVARKDRRVRYIIWNRRIIYGPWSSGVMAGTSRPWIWQAYTGINAHKAHMHVSVGYSAAAENDVSPWWADEKQEEDDMTNEQARQLKFLFEAVSGAVGAGQKSFPGTIEATLATAQEARTDAAAARAGVADLTKRFDAWLLKQGGSENPAGKIP